MIVANRRCVHTRSTVNSAGSNDPLKGGKGSLWDGGYRVPGFIGGGLIPNAMRGKQLDGVIHICDWWPTFASLAGLPIADATGPTPTDGAETPLFVLLSRFRCVCPEPVLENHCFVTCVRIQKGRCLLWFRFRLFFCIIVIVMVNVRSGIDQSAYIFGKVASSPRKETVLDHLMHCVAGPGYDPEQCVEGQTPDFPAGVSATASYTICYLTATTQVPPASSQARSGSCLESIRLLW